MEGDFLPFIPLCGTSVAFVSGSLWRFAKTSGKKIVLLKPEEKRRGSHLLSF